ncbi:phenylalanine--tRNA ligase subunit beta [uncultured Arsenicicoccus sp.]|uniref:phenylalanine--tRNA ligase subunit beta n=1 Tax=uncultured Arsenicicoccus sp. TaxID=491339 RepID=UPI0025970529|nr:phenylalanine--tRNA ligase subunit beta [uncultured Arsenicicoccus sp.]
MRAPVSWLRELVGEDVLPVTATGVEVAAALVKVGLEEEGLHGGDVTGPLVVGRVLDFTDEPQRNGKVIRWCTVDVGRHGQMVTEGKHQEIICGAHNFAVGDLVVVALPGATLPGGFRISARKTYGHVSNGMMCAVDELGLGEDHSGVIVLGDYLADDPERLARAVPGADAVELLGLGDEVVEVNITPDRGYAFSMRGIARDLALSLGAPFTDPAAEPARTAPAGDGSGYPVRLADDAPLDGRPGCDRYVARVVRGVDVQATTPPWMATRLTQLGMRPISLTVDVTNYVMLLLGQPLHAFDLDRLSGSIEVRRARPGERLTTLDGVERALDPQDLLITDGGETPLVIAGVMGGEDCEVTGTTTDVLVEAAHFDPVSVARSARRHKLPSEAAKRFERGVDPELTAAAAELVVQLLEELGGGTPDPGVTDVGSVALPEPFSFDVTLPTRLVGLTFERPEVLEVLREIGCTVEDLDGDQVQVTPPSWRPDLRNGPDLVEEVARVRGYAQIPSELPQAPGGRGLTPAQRSRRLVTATLAQQGLVEVLSSPFVAADRFDAFGYGPDDERRRTVRLANPINDEQPLLRTTLLDTLLDVLRRNVSRGSKDLAIYELGLVTRTDGRDRKAPIPPLGRRPDDETLRRIDEAVPAQPWHAALVLTGDSAPAGPWGPARPVTATDAVAVVVEAARALGVSLEVVQDEQAPWHPGRCARLVLPDGATLGHAGELHPRVLAALELPARTCAAEIDVDLLATAAGEAVAEARKLSTYPVAHSDVALVVDEQVPAAVLERALRDGAGAELEHLALFDVFRSDQLGPGKKSLAYRLTVRAADRTLTTEEVSAVRDRAISAAAQATGATQRGA